MSSNKIVRASYTVDDVFCIPKNINLEDKTQVESWGVKYHTLYIYLTNGKELEISNRGWIDSCDYKYPSETKILDAEKVGCIDDDDEDFEEVDIGEERHFGCDKCEYYFNEGKDHCKSCGFDLNIFNKPESDSEEEDEEEPVMNKCFSCFKDYQMSKMYYKNCGFYCSLECRDNN